jgi:uncharacterized protein YeaO (DUF488 family)
MIRIERIYSKSLSHDNVYYTILVDRLWPRGIRKDQVRVDLWLKDIAPSDRLRRWFGHDPAKWDEFKKRYFAELETKEELVRVILDKAKNGSVCLLYGARDEKHNDAVAGLKTWHAAKALTNSRREKLRQSRY